MKKLLLFFTILICCKVQAQVWTGSNISTQTNDAVKIEIPSSVANLVSTPHFTIQRNLPLFTNPNPTRQPYIEVSQYYPGWPPGILPYTNYIFTLNEEGYAAFGYKDATSPLHVKLPFIYNQKSFNFSTIGSQAQTGNVYYANGLKRQFFYVNRTKESFYANIVRNDDHALIFTDGLNTLNASVQKFDDSGEPTTTAVEEQNFNQSSGLVIAPWYTPLNNNDFRGMRIDAEGNVGIGTYTTFGNKLAINGTMTCKEINMDISYAWPDFVFDPSYKLMPISALSKFIVSNHHLPGLPTAIQVQAHGYKVGEVQTQMLQKIEELTLYIISLEKRIAELEHKKQ